MILLLESLSTTHRVVAAPGVVIDVGAGAHPATATVTASGIAAIAAAVAVLVAAPFLAYSDLRWRTLPNRLVLPLIAIAIVAPVLDAVCTDSVGCTVERSAGPAPPGAGIAPLSAVGSGRGDAVVVLGVTGVLGLLGVWLGVAGAWGMGDAKLAFALEVLIAERGSWRLALFGLGTALAALIYGAVIVRVARRRSTGPDHGCERAPPRRASRRGLPSGRSGGLPCGPWLLTGAFVALILPG